MTVKKLVIITFACSIVFGIVVSVSRIIVKDARHDKTKITVSDTVRKLTDIDDTDKSAWSANLNS